MHRRIMNDQSTLTCIIIEDEPLALLRTKEYVERIPFLRLLHTYSNPLEALTILGSGNIDLLFLDIQMEQLTGIQLLQSLSQPPAVILTTAYEEFALKAFELDVTDYLLKPFSFERFLAAVMKVQQRKAQASLPAFLFFKTANQQQRIELDAIHFIEGARDYRKIYYADQTLLTLETFGELEERLPASLFCRVHKSYIAAISKIKTIETDQVLIGKTWIPVSESYKKKLLSVIGATLRPGKNQG
ncbi:MAG: LytTR family DNA-binding domain-containing protein [Chitinophagaceae bacterium]